jgi:hypothetical protein
MTSSRWIVVSVDGELHDVYEDEARRQTRELGQRVSMAQVVKAELARGKKRIENKLRTAERGNQ